MNFGLQFFLWVLFGYTVVVHFIDWLPRVGIHMTINKILLYSITYVIAVSLFPYLNNYFLIESFYRKHNYIQYFFWFIVGVVMSLFLFVGIDYIFIYPNIPTWFFIPIHYLSRLPYVFIFTLAMYLFKIYEEFYLQKEEQLKLERAKSEAELLALKSQINPHFLFNTLNNIQSLSFTNPEKASETIVNLSNLFRYISYEGHRNVVTLGEEIKYIKNYLSLSVMKKAWLDKVTFEVENVDQTIVIEPLLLVNFIENAFKHGSLDNKDDFIKIQIKTEDTAIFFTCSNTFINKQKESGLIGLSNVKKRLELVYPNQYKMNVEILDNKYTVNLILYYGN